MNDVLIVKALPTSYVRRRVKTISDSGSGESKLFVGPIKREEEFDRFFTFTDKEYSYSFSRDNMLDYLNQVKFEYVYQLFNKYKAISLDVWTKSYEQIKSLNEDDFTVHLSKFTDSTRYYVRANEKIYMEIFRDIVIPRLTNVVFEKDESIKRITINVELNTEYKNVDGTDSSVLNYNVNLDLKHDYPRNRIVFGAPGTGKSFKINAERIKLLGEDNENDYERVTFHPDYSYANFVGSYKPVMVVNESIASLEEDTMQTISILNDNSLSAQEKYDLLFEKFKKDGLTRLPLLLGLYTDEPFKTKKLDGSNAANDNSVEKNHGRAIRKYVKLISGKERLSDIAYEYVPGPFMRVYVSALKSACSDNPRPYLLIIEEINRANVAAVFGDVFQLLDRGEDNASEYPIEASEDIKKYLAKELGGQPEDYTKIRIPSNMFIWATMNSADQGVFPMDTAFKRRWNFTYLGIDDSDNDIQGKYVVIGSQEKQRFEWNALRKAINEFLANEGINEDKQLGPYFISRSIVIPANGGKEIDSKAFCEVFKNKVLMYLFDDAAKHRRSSLFKGSKKGYSRFSKICEAFDEQGIDIFDPSIRSSIEVTKLTTDSLEQDKNENE